MTNPITLTTRTTVKSRTIDLSNSLPDITANIIPDSEYYLLPSDIFESAVFAAINELVDDFAINPEKYLQPHHHSSLDRIAQQYLDS